MVRKLTLLAFLLGLAQSAWAVPALVRKCPSGGIAGGNNTGTTVTCGFASNSSGNALIIFGLADGSGNTISISDTAANTWTAAQSNLTVSGKLVTSVWYTCNANISAGTNTVTVTVNNSVSNSYIGGGEYSGLATTACIDQTVNASVNTTAWNSGNVTTTVASELFTGFAMGGNGAATLSAGTNVAWALQGSTTTGSMSPGWEDFIAGSTQTVSAQFTYSATTNGQCIIVTFKTPAATGGGAVKKKKVIFY